MNVVRAGAGAETSIDGQGAPIGDSSLSAAYQDLMTRALNDTASTCGLSLTDPRRTERENPRRAACPAGVRSLRAG